MALPKDQQGRGQRKSRPQIQVTSLQPCVDLSQVCLTPTELWKDASKLVPRNVDTAGVSPSLDRLLGVHAGAGRRGESSMLHEAPSEVVAFGAVFGLSCNSVWGYTAKNWEKWLPSGQQLSASPRSSRHLPCCSLRAI